MADWRNPPPRAPRPMTPGRSGSGVTRRRRAGARAGKPPRAGRLRAQAHAASFPSAIQAVGTCRVGLEDVGPVSAAETIDTVGVALSPRDPQERRRRLGAVVLPAHACHLPGSGQRRGDPDPLRGRSSGRLAPRARGSPLRCHPTPPACGMQPPETDATLGRIPAPPFLSPVLVAGGRLQSNRLWPGGEDKKLFQSREGDNFIETLDGKRQPCAA